MSDAPRIDGVRTRVFTVPTEEPEADGTLQWDSTTAVVAIVSAAGKEGMGWTYSDAAVAGLIQRHLAGVIQGETVTGVATMHDAMVRALRNVGATGVGSAAISAVDVALWDLYARTLGVPVSALLAGPPSPLPVYGSGGFTTYDDARTSEQLESWVEGLGAGAVKIKVGEAWGGAVARDVHRIELARHVIGSDVGLMVDANGAYSVGQARRMEQVMRQWGVSWFEEPVSSRDLDGLANVRGMSLADVAAGEYAWTLADARELLDHGAVDVLQADVTRCGGFTGFGRIAALAAAYERPVSAHTAPALSTHAALGAPTLAHLEWFHDHVRVERMLFDGVPEAAHGLVSPPDVPGHGMTLREGDVASWEEA